MSKRTGKSRGWTLWRFTLSYLILLLIPLAMSVNAYLVAMRLTEQYIMESNQLIVSAAMDKLESSLSEAERFALTLSQMDDMKNAMQCQRPTESSCVYVIQKAILQLPVFSDANHIITGYSLYSSAGDYMLAPLSAYLNLSRDYEKSLKYEGMDYTAFREQVLDMRRVTGMLPLLRHKLLAHEMQDSLTLFFPYLLPDSGRNVGKVMFYLHAGSVEKALQPVLDMGATRVDLVDRTGTLLMRMPKNAGEPPPAIPLWGTGTNRQKVAGEKTLVSYQTGAQHVLTVRILTPMRVIVGRCSALLTTLLLGMCILVLIGVVLAMLVARQNRRPLGRLIDRLETNVGGVSGLGIHSLWDVDRAVHRLTDHHTLLEQQLQEQRLQLKSAFVHQLISGGIHDELELETLLHHVDMDLNGGAYRGIYMDLPEEGELSEDVLQRADSVRKSVFALLAPYDRQLKCLLILDHACFILLYVMNMAQEEVAILHALLGEIYQKLQNGCGRSPRFFVGHACATLQSLHHSFSAAQRLRELHEKGNDVFLWIAEANPSAGGGYAYSIRDEQRLATLADKGRLEELRAELEVIYRRNFEELSLRDVMCRLLYHRMASTLALSPDFQMKESDLDAKLLCLSGREFFDALAAQYQIWCEQSRRKMETTQNQLISDTLSYVHAHYTDDAMGLAAVALYFGVTESHLSSFFKEKVGKTFSAYLEAVRIENANSLLLATEDTIDEIARRVGYTNADSFRRAYRRVCGCSPSQYRSATSEH